MNQFLLFFIFIATALTSCNYEPGVSEAFAKYKYREGVTSITVPGWAIGLATMVADLEDEEKELLSCIDRVKVLSVENNDLNARINLHNEFYEHINRKGDYDELLVVRENNENVTIFGKMTEDAIKEMVILVGGDENAMIYLKGEIRPEQINKFIDVSEPNKLLSMKF